MEGPTDLIPVTPEPPPVFVDSTGRRRRRLRRLAYCAGAAGVLYTGLVGISFAGGPVTPDTVIPFVEATAEDQRPASTPPTTSPPPSATAVPPPARTAPARPPVTSATPGGTSGTAGPTAGRSPRPTGSPSTVPPTTRPPAATTAPPTTTPATTAPPTTTPPPVIDLPDLPDLLTEAAGTAGA
ncbi:hypothetical protein [Micromonospora humi]|uniref:hypothetical protein n=1 Tax=Micromonospora humi TaxID=745366 RepID=UPI0015863A1E|nr:hypothetical protein [Micromonospora humi]